MRSSPVTDIHVRGDLAENSLPGKGSRCRGVIVLALCISCTAALMWLAALVARFPAGDFLAPAINYRWDAEDCDDRAAFVCQDVDTGIYRFFGGTRDDKANWLAANERCEAMGLILATVHSQSDHDRLLDVHQRSGADHAGYWIGLNDRAEECFEDGLCFRWAPDGAALRWTAWESDEPRTSDEPGRKDCVMAEPCSGSMDTDCNTDTQCVLGGCDSDGAVADGSTAQQRRVQFRRLALALLAAGSCACAAAAMLGCVSSIFSGQAVLGRRLPTTSAHGSGRKLSGVAAAAAAAVP